MTTLRASRLLLARAFHRGATCLRRWAVQSHQLGAALGRGAGRACPSDCRVACGVNVEAARPLENGAPLPQGILLEARSAGWCSDMVLTSTHTASPRSPK